MNIGNISVGVEVNTEKLTAGLKDVGKKISDTKSMFGGFVVTLQDVVNVSKQVASAFYSVVLAAGEAELVTRQLADAMKAQGIYTDKALEANLDYATSLTKVSKYTDEEIASTMKLLTNFGLHDEQLRAVTASTLDLATRTGSLDSAATLLGKAFQGETSRLKMVGIQIDENIPRSQKFGAVMKVVRNQFGGTAAGEVDTYLGSLQQMKNEFGEVAEAIGASNGILDKMKELNQNLTTLATSMKAEVPSALDVVKESFKRLADNAAVKPFIDMFKKVSELSTKAAIAVDGDGKYVVDSKKDVAKQVVAIQEKQSNTEKNLAAQASKSIAKGYKDALAEIKEKGLDWKKFFIDMHGAVTDSLATAFTDMALEGKNFGDAMGAMWDNLKKAVIQILAQMAAQAIVNFMLMGTTWNAVMLWMTTAAQTMMVAIGPIGWILLAITGAILVLKNNIDDVMIMAQKHLDNLMNPLKAIESVIKGLIEAVQKLIDSLNDLFSFDLPSLDDLSDRLSFDFFAKGVRNFAGGMAVVGEQGPELVRLPTGSDVYSNQESRGMVSEFRSPTQVSGSRGSAGNVSIVINATVRADEDWEKVTRNKIIPSLARYMKKTANSPFA